MVDRWLRVWSLARLQEAVSAPVDVSNVVLGPVQVHGTGKVRLGRNAFVYPDVVLETQGEGCIDIGYDVVLSRGVHIVAFERFRLADVVMVDESRACARKRSLQQSTRCQAPVIGWRGRWKRSPTRTASRPAS